MNIKSKLQILCLILAGLLLTASLSFGSKSEEAVQETSDVDVYQITEVDLTDDANFDCVICIEHEDYVMGMDGYHESLVENTV